jgi:hypothetical protein
MLFRLLDDFRRRRNISRNDKTSDFDGTELAEHFFTAFLAQLLKERYFTFSQNLHAARPYILCKSGESQARFLNLGAVNGIA